MSLKPPNHITPAGLKKIQDELNELLYKERPVLVKTVAWAASNGDRSENADYIYGKKRLREIDRRIHFLQSRLDNIDLVDPAKLDLDHVSFGAIVTIENEDGKKQTYQIVGVDEIDIPNGKISWKSPLAKALIGKKEGDETLVRKPKGDEDVYVVKIEYK